MIAGHVYVVHTALTRPLPKDKITRCVCAADDLFFWINTAPRSHGIGQLDLSPSDHPRALTRPCFLDCSRVTTFPAHELRAAQARGAISPALAARIVRLLTDAPPKTLAPRHVRAAIAGLSTLLTP